METTTFDINGMTCSGCVNSVTRVLQAVSGVVDAKVTLTPGQAKIQFDPALANVSLLKAAIEDAGYEVH
jgi:copper chaperone